MEHCLKIMKRFYAMLDTFWRSSKCLPMTLTKHTQIFRFCLARALRALFGGNWNNSANAGLWCWNLNNAAGNSNSNIGSRLTLLKEVLNYCEKVIRKAETSPTRRNRLSERGLVSRMVAQPNRI